MKKTTIAAAKKAAKKAVKKAPVKKTAAKKATKKVAKKAIEPIPAPIEPAKKVAKKAAKKVTKKATKKVAKKKTVALPETKIVANVDVGFGNTLYLRGDAPGLSWAEGVPMEPATDSTWTISIAGLTDPFEFKVLINDTYWSAGYNIPTAPGTTIEFAPEF